MSRLIIDDNIQDILDEHGYETATGRIQFRSPCYKLICDQLGIRYSLLSRAGKGILHADMVEQYCKRGRIRTCNEYLNNGSE